RRSLVPRSPRWRGDDRGEGGRAAEPKPVQSRGLKLTVPSQCQLTESVGGETWAVALNHVNFPVPPQNVHNPRPVMPSSVQWPNALLAPGPAVSRTTRA